MDLQDKLKQYLEKRLNTQVEIQDFISLSGGGGACQDNYSLRLEVSSGEWEGTHELVMRTDKGASLYASISKKDEFRVTSIAHERGVKTPRPYWLEEDGSYTGNPFFVMQRINGKANGRYLVKDRTIEKARKNLPHELAENLAKIHSIQPTDCKEEDLHKVLGAGRKLDKDYAADEIKTLREEVAKLKEPHPAIELILNWAEKNKPEVNEIVLVHGDFRTGNFMVSENGLEGILDWEFAHWGEPYEDIAWLCMRDWRFGRLNKEAGGICTRKEFYDLYSKYAKEPVDANRVLFWEVIGNLRWAIGSVGQAERHLSGKDRGIELAAIGRRSCEMEFEAMRLIENAG
ncbi:MAG: phosphotransferase family protein [Leptospiraceae bacterium]|nr:phosphotransferase family protein [Leptospiraceae bacterium]MCP5498627.1 phosphotransferase family protein [Leptospiraceae bacterium]